MELISYAALLWAWLEHLVAAIPRFLLVATAAYVIIYCTTLALVAGVHRHWWRIAWFRSLFYWQFPLTLLGVVCCGLSRYHDVPWLWTVGTSLFSALTLYLGAFLIAALLVTPVVLGVSLYDRLRQEGTEGPSSVERRRFSQPRPRCGTRPWNGRCQPRHLHLLYSARGCPQCRSTIPTCPPS